MAGKHSRHDDASRRAEAVEDRRRGGLPKEWDEAPAASLRWKVGSDLSSLDPRSTPGWGGDRAQGESLMAAHADELSDLQERLFAEGRTGGSRSVLLVLQGLDTSGKGGIVRHVVGLVDPQGVMHRSFGVPTEEEKAQGYLWRIRNALPRPGYIGVFDRSHYEQVLVVRVAGIEPREQWEAHYDELNAFDAEVAASGTSIVKVALALSRDEQKSRLSKRLERPDKYWKYNPSDIDTRLRWDDYQAAYQDMLDRTHTDVAPWHVVPADRKWFARLAVSELLLDALRRLDLGWPPADFDVEVEKKRLAET
jgi:PPK2 family polyphosphate:nucleotide phosphotransferase